MLQEYFFLPRKPAAGAGELGDDSTRVTGREATGKAGGGSACDTRYGGRSEDAMRWLPLGEDIAGNESG